LVTASPSSVIVQSFVTGEPRGWNAHAFFNDPDGNGWLLQQSPDDE
jgi:hypothetical protein